MVAHQTYFKPTLIGMLIGVRLDLNRHDNVFLNLKHQKPTLKSGKTSRVFVVTLIEIVKKMLILVVI